MKYPIYIMGFMASGKTSKGKKVAKKLGVTFIDLDEEIERKEGTTISQIFEQKGEEYFRRLEADVLRSLSAGVNAIVALGGGTPCFHQNIEYINKTGSSVYLKSSPNRILGRLRQKKAKRPLIANLSDSELKVFIDNKLAERTSFYEKANYTIEVDDLKTNDLLLRIEQLLKGA